MAAELCRINTLDVMGKGREPRESIAATCSILAPWEVEGSSTTCVRAACMHHVGSGSGAPWLWQTAPPLEVQQARSVLFLN